MTSICVRDSGVPARQLQPFPSGGGQGRPHAGPLRPVDHYFSQWLSEKGLPADKSNLTRDNVLGWLDTLRARGLTTGTIRTRWRGLRRFVNWLVAEDILAKDPLGGIVVDKPEPPSVPILTDEELIALVNACKGKAFNDLRDAAVIRLLIDCGLRVSELTGIDTKDLDLDAESVEVTGCA